MTDSDRVKLRADDGLAIITLDNPKALNALTLDMIDAIAPQLAAWEADPAIEAIIINAVGDKAFCAGGDVRAVALAGRSDDPDMRRLTWDFFRREYTLNHAIYRCTKPYVAVIDGITMGGGVGLSVHGRYRVATERTMLAMPETAIGFFPDVGASHALNMLSPAMAAFLALTGWRLNGADCVALGIATHYLDSDRLEALQLALAGMPGNVAAVLDRMNETPPDAPIMQHEALIERCFNYDTVDEFAAALRHETDPFAGKLLASLDRMSPTSCRVTLAQLLRTRGLSFEECMTIEFRMSQHFMAGHEFYEGIRAMLIDKDRDPQWQPPSLADVTLDMVESYFAPIDGPDLVFSPEN